MSFVSKIFRRGSKPKTVSSTAESDTKDASHSAPQPSTTSATMEEDITTAVPTEAEQVSSDSEDEDSQANSEDDESSDEDEDEEEQDELTDEEDSKQETSSQDDSTDAVSTTATVASSSIAIAGSASVTVPVPSSSTAASSSSSSSSSKISASTAAGVSATPFVVPTWEFQDDDGTFKAVTEEMVDFLEYLKSGKDAAYSHINAKGETHGYRISKSDKWNAVQTNISTSKARPLKRRVKSSPTTRDGALLSTAPVSKPAKNWQFRNDSGVFQDVDATMNDFLLRLQTGRGAYFKARGHAYWIAKVSDTDAMQINLKIGTTRELRCVITGYSSSGGGSSSAVSKSLKGLLTGGYGSDVSDSDDSSADDSDLVPSGLSSFSSLTTSSSTISRTASSSSSAPMVWQFQDDSGKWVTVSSEMSKFINGLTLGTSQKYSSHGQVYTVTRDGPVSAKQKNVGSGRTRFLRAVKSSSASATGGGSIQIIWQYLTDNDTFDSVSAAQMKVLRKLKIGASKQVTFGSNLYDLMKVTFNYAVQRNVKYGTQRVLRAVLMDSSIPSSPARIVWYSKSASRLYVHSAPWLKPEMPIEMQQLCEATAVGQSDSSSDPVFSITRKSGSSVLLHHKLDSSKSVVKAKRIVVPLDRNEKGIQNSDVPSALFPPIKRPRVSPVKPAYLIGALGGSSSSSSSSTPAWTKMDVSVTGDSEAKKEITDIIIGREVERRFNNDMGSSFSINMVFPVANSKNLNRLRKFKMDTEILERRFVYHGTADPMIVKKISVNGFNRDYNETHMWGKGVYFAKDAMGSHHYTDTDSKGLRWMFVCWLGITHAVRGARDITSPPTHSDGVTEVDTLVNDESDPSIFVAMKDDRCVPLWIISYS